jgi:hypothetical protein
MYFEVYEVHTLQCCICILILLNAYERVVAGLVR